MLYSPAFRQVRGMSGRVVVRYSTQRTTYDSSEKEKKTLIIGASGSIGQQLLQALNKEKPFSTIAALHRTPLPEDIAKRSACEFGFNIRDKDSIRNLFDKHGKSIDSVWNLAAPLSVDTAKDPASARDITVHGMERVLECMNEFNVKKLYFSDSIGSYGLQSPRHGATAAWLGENPTQDPGSDYGVQKRECRDLLHEYARTYNFDTRFLIIPGVLHTQSTWGGGTTEYALDAMQAASSGAHYVCPVPGETLLPMIHSDDLIRGMIALMNTDPQRMPAQCRGMAMAGFSFTPIMLFKEIWKYYPNFTYTFDSNSNPNVAKFARTWPDTLSPHEAADINRFVARNTLTETVRDVLFAMRERQQQHVPGQQALRTGGGKQDQPQQAARLKFLFPVNPVRKSFVV